MSTSPWLAAKRVAGGRAAACIESPSSTAATFAGAGESRSPRRPADSWTSPPAFRSSLERACDEALVRGLVTFEAIDAVTERYPKREGVARIRALGRPDRKTTATRSEAEERFLAMVRKARLPEPEVNVRVGRFVADFRWRAEQVATALARRRPTAA
jgi:hypothetical protein